MWIDQTGKDPTKPEFQPNVTKTLKMSRGMSSAKNSFLEIYFIRMWKNVNLKSFCKDWFQCHSGELKRLDTGLLKHIRTIWAFHSYNNIFPSVKHWQKLKLSLLMFQFRISTAGAWNSFHFLIFSQPRFFTNGVMMSDRQSECRVKVGQRRL